MKSSFRFDRVRTFPRRPIAFAESTPKLPTIAIIGGGLSGALVAIYLLNTANQPLQIKLIEHRSQVGLGLAYGTHQDCHLLNVPANKVSAFAAEPNHFLHWLHQQVDRSLPATAFVPRRYYGQYIQSLLQEAVAHAPSQVQFEQIRDEAISIQSSNNQLSIALRSGDRQRVEQAVLALGNLPSRPLDLADPGFIQSPRYIASAWSEQDLAKLEPDAAVLLVGSGLTAVDVVLTLRQQGHQGLIYIVSRRGLLPQSHQISTASSPAAEPPIAWEHLATLFPTTRGLLRQVRHQVSQASAAGQDWRSVMDALRPHGQTLWQQLPLAEKQRFLRHVRPYWDVHRHRMAPTIAQQIATLLQEKSIILYAGQILSCQEDPAGVEVVMQQRGKTTLDKLRVQAVVNCTGPAGVSARSARPLMRNLLAAGLVRSDLLNIGLDVAPNGALINAEGIPSSQLYTLGCLKRGLLWETTAISEIRSQARALSEQLLLNINSAVLHSSTQG